MPSVTEANVVDSAVSKLEALSYVQAVAQDEQRQPLGTVDKAFTVTYRGDTPAGQIGYFEEARGLLTVSVVRLVNNDYDAVARALRNDARTILAGLVRDGATSGQYAVDDAGQSQDVVQPRGAAYARLTLRVPVNFEAAL